MINLLAYYRLRRKRKAEVRKAKESEETRSSVERLVNVRIYGGRLMVYVKGETRDIFIDPSMFKADSLEEVVSSIVKENIKLSVNQ